MKILKERICEFKDNVIKKIIYEWNYLGVPKNRRLDYYLKELISKKTNFEINKIEVLIAKKTRMKIYNEFNYFEFKYKRKIYKLLDDKLKVIEEY